MSDPIAIHWFWLLRKAWPEAHLSRSMWDRAAAGEDIDWTRPYEVTYPARFGVEDTGQALHDVQKGLKYFAELGLIEPIDRTKEGMRYRLNPPGEVYEALNRARQQAADTFEAQVVEVVEMLNDPADRKAAGVTVDPEKWAEAVTITERRMRKRGLLDRPLEYCLKVYSNIGGDLTGDNET